MQIIKKFTAVRISQIIEQNEYLCQLKYGTIQDSSYERYYPETEFDNEDDAIEYAYKTGEYADWVIIPFIRFQN